MEGGGRRVKSLQSLLKKATNDLGYPDVFYEGLLRGAWPRIIGEPMSNLARVASFKQGVIIIETPSPAMKEELEFHRKEIEKKIRHEGLKFKKLIFRVGGS